MGRVLIGCEYSGVVRRAFRDLGHDAWSCDLLPSEDDSPYHLQEDVRVIVAARRWDMAIFFPPCTHLAVSGARWFTEKRDEQEEARAFVRWLMDCPVPRIAIENPVSIISSRIRKPDQILEPHHHGHGETKKTCLWLKNLPPLFATHLVPGRVARVHLMPPSPERWKERSRTYPGIGRAMATQWGAFAA